MPRGKPPPPQQAIHSRLSFLHQASSLLSTSPTTAGLSRYYTSHLLSVSKKSVQRLSTPVKHTLCKRCSSILVPAITSTTTIENKSKNGRKRWADVVVVECRYCGKTKRFPTVDREEVKAKKEKKTITTTTTTSTTTANATTTTMREEVDGDAAMTGT
ncbi:hypothetical protein TWF281_010966 [Arthrobotrys megalospora]